MKNFPKISIIFPTHNGITDTIDCLKSIRALSYPKEKIEIIIVDNNSIDGTSAKAKQLFPKVNLISLKSNLGFAKAVNLGAKKAIGKYLLISNNDVVFTPNYLKILVRSAEKINHLGAIGGLVYFKDKKDKISSSGYNFNFWLGSISETKVQENIYKSEWVQGCQILTPRDVFQKLNGLDEKYYFYFEDADYCLRLRKNNLEVYIEPKAKIYHGNGLTFKKEGSDQQTLMWYTSKFIFMFKNSSFLQKIVATFLQFVIFSPYQFIINKSSYNLVVKSLFGALNKI